MFCFFRLEFVILGAAEGPAARVLSVLSYDVSGALKSLQAHYREQKFKKEKKNLCAGAQINL